MNLEQNIPPFPEQSGPEKIHGLSGDPEKKEKYIRDAGKIEDYPEEEKTGSRKTSDIKPVDNPEDSTHLTDVSGEEKKEDYINTDERKNDINRKNK